MVKYLISKGADINAKSRRGDAPLHWSAIYSNCFVVVVVEYIV